MKETKLDRRNFLKTTAVGAAGLSLIANSTADAAEAPFVLPESISRRHIIPLNHKWLYSEKASPAAMQANFNDKTWTKITIPHTNRMLPANGFDEKEYTFVSAYRRHFRLPKELKDHRIFIDFGAVMTAAKVFINDKNLGEYKGGYTPFSFELTNDIKWNADNVLAVKVDSTERKDIPPFGNMVDYLTFGGIYRVVQMRAVPTSFFANVFANPVDVLSSDRKLNVTVFLEGTQKPPISISVSLLDGEKEIAAVMNSNIGEGSEHTLVAEAGAITLWVVSNPKLYDVRVKLSAAG